MNCAIIISNMSFDKEADSSINATIISPISLDLLGQIASDERKQVAKDAEHKLVRVRNIADQNNTFNGGKGLEEVNYSKKHLP